MAQSQSKGAIFISAAFVILCSSGLVYHVSEISKTYFKFSTNSRLELITPEKLPVPSLSLCWQYDYVIEERDVRREIPGLPRLGEGLVGARYKDFMMNKMTMEQIFRLTPKRDEILVSCFLRYPIGKVVEPFKQICNQKFAISKFYTRQHICYDLQLAAEGEYDYYSVTDSVIYASMAYTVFMAKSFSRGEYFIPVVHDPDTSPTDSLRYSGTVGREINLTTGDAKTFHYYLSYSFVKLHRMPPPYDNMCFVYESAGLSNQRHCYARCLIQLTSKAFGRFPSSELISENTLHNLSMRHMVSNNMSDKDYFKLKSYESECGAKCSQPDCYQKYHITSVLAENPRPELAFRVDLPRSTSFTINFTPAMLLSEFLLYVMSCCGTYLGVSLVHMNPLAILTRFRRPETRKRQLVDNRAVAANPLFKHADCSNNYERIYRRLRRIELRLLQR